MAKNSIAETNIQFGIDATQISSGMGQVKQKVEKDGKDLAKSVAKANTEVASQWREQLKQVGTEKVGELFGGGSMLGMGAKAGLIGLAVAGVATLGKEILDVANQTRIAGKEVDDLFRKFQEKGAARLESLNEAKAELAALDGVAGTTEGWDKRVDVYERIRREHIQLIASLKRAKMAEKELDEGKWGSVSNFAYYFGEGPGLDKMQADALARRLEMEKQVKAFGKLLIDQNKQFEKVGNPWKNDEAVKSLQEFIQAQKDAVKYFDKSELQQLDKLGAKFGFSDADLAEARRQIEYKKVQLEQLQEQKRLEDEVKNNQKSANKEAQDWFRLMGNEVGLYGKVVKQTSEHLKLEELIRKGADEKQIERLRKLIDLKERMNDKYQPLTSIELGSAEEISMNARVKFDEQRNSDLKKQVEILQKELGVLNVIKDTVKAIAKKETPEI